MQYRILPLTWREMSLPDPARQRSTEALAQAIYKWTGTPYMAGQCLPGVGVDCVRLICAILNDLRGHEVIPISTVPPDAALHNRETAIAAMRSLLKAYNPTKVENRMIEPGDILVVSYSGGGPGHGMLVGPVKNTLYHSDGRGVVKTGMALPCEFQRVHGIYRLPDRQDWA